MGTSLSYSIRLAAAVGVTLAVLTPSVQAQEIVRKGEVTGVKATTRGGAQVDFANARPFELPVAPMSASVQAEQDLITSLVNQSQASAVTDSGEVSGAEGDGAWLGSSEQGPASEALNSQAGGEIQPAEHGTSRHPFSTARADLSSPTNTMYPYRTAGKLYFKVTPTSGDSWCSASLIKRGVIVTAAHCVAAYGQQRFYSNWRFVPGERNGSGRIWNGAAAWVMSSYFTGAPGTCAVAGIICINDVAVIELAPQTNPTYPGTSLGWLGYGWNKFGFTTNNLTHITQLGYPQSLDFGRLMQRNDSQGFIAGSSLSGNTIIGSLMRQGSSGGPWVLNFGYRPTLNGTTNGTYPNPNIVIGVTSWLYLDHSIKQLGASPFTSTNIVPLVAAACAGGDPRCL